MMRVGVGGREGNGVMEKRGGQGREGMREGGRKEVRKGGKEGRNKSEGS